MALLLRTQNAGGKLISLAATAIAARATEYRHAWLAKNPKITWSKYTTFFVFLSSLFFLFFLFFF
jgi:hypothetical protein